MAGKWRAKQGEVSSAAKLLAVLGACDDAAGSSAFKELEQAVFHLQRFAQLTRCDVVWVEVAGFDPSWALPRFGTLAVRLPSDSEDL